MSQPANALLWAKPDDAPSQATVSDAATDCGLNARFCSFSGLMDLLRKEPEVVVGVELGSNPELALALVQEIHAQFPALAILVATAEANVGIIRAAFEAGACDVMSSPVQKLDLQKGLIKAVTHGAKASGEAAASGQVVTIFGARGGLGVTTLAVNLAVQLSKLTQAGVALADMDLQRGDCAAFLNLNTSQSISTLAASGSIDDLILFSSLIRHASGISVLAAPQHMEEADEVEPEHADAIISRLKQRFRFTVVDTARTLTATTAAVLNHTDRVLIVSDLSLPSVRSLHRLAGVLRGLSVSREGLDLIVVEGEHDMVPVADASRAIAKPPLVTISRDAAAAAAAMNAGAPLNGPKPSPLLVSIVELATKLSGVQGATTIKRSLWQQIFSKGASS